MLNKVFLFKLFYFLTFMIAVSSMGYSEESTSVAVPPNHPPSTLQITTQAVQTGELSKNYEVTGENIIALLDKMVDFSNPQTAIVFNRWTGQLFVRHNPSVLNQIEKIIHKVRESVNRQVEIEARIVTVQGTDFSQIGTDLLGIDHLQRGDDGNVRVGTDSSFGDGTYNTFLDFQNLTDDDGSNTGGQISIKTFSRRFNMTALIDLLEKNSQANTLAAPRLTVFNNQRAHIKIQRVDYYVKQITSQSDAGADAVATQMEVSTANSGTVLDVTPTINKDKTITLELHPQFVTADLTDTQTINVSNTTLIGSDSQPFVTLPIFKNQAVDTTATIEDGGVIVLGGLIDEQENVTWQRIPGIWRAPLIGKIFQNRSTSKIKKHVLIFIRAKALLPVRLESDSH